MIKIRDIMVKDVITVEPRKSVKKAVELMKKNEIGCLIVVQDEKPIGIVTERDMLNRVLMSDRDPQEIKVQDIMTNSLVSGKPDMEIMQTARLMFKRGIKKLPVIDGGRLIGLVTLTDLVYSQEVLEEMAGLLSAMEEAPPKRIVKVLHPLLRIVGPVETPAEHGKI